MFSVKMAGWLLMVKNIAGEKGGEKSCNLMVLFIINQIHNAKLMEAYQC